MADMDLKQQNSINGLQGSESNDRLSSLHDSILDHILSFLPTREVVRTGILSKRWKSLWIGVSIFDITDFRCSSTACWNFVERVLVLRNRSSIKQFKLWFRAYPTPSNPRVQSIISSLFSHKIPHLDISLYVDHQFTLPSSIFDCQSLRILKLQILKTYHTKLTLEHISLPCLKVLHLRDFKFQNAESIEKLFSSCPVLEELNLERCRLIHWNDISISIPSLKSLTMDDSFEKYDLPKSSCYIKVEAPSLQSFNYTGRLTHHLYLTNTSSSSIKACIHMMIRNEFTPPYSIFDCQSLRILKLEILKGSQKKFALEHISLPCLKVLHLRDFAFSNAESIEKLFSCCPVLEELNLERCRLIHQNDISISIPSLKSLTMVDSFDDPKSSCYIRLEAPSLQSFNYTGLLTHHLYLTKMSSSSIKACIRMIWNDYYVEIRAPRLVKLLQDLENMISLTISNQAVELLFLLEDRDSDRFPVFHHLESLHLNFKLTGHVFQGLLKFIYFFTPNLRTIKFSDVKFRMLKPLPNCFSSSLKFLELRNVDGHSHEVFFLTCYLEKAALLQKINIYQSKYISVDKQQVLRDEVEKLSTRFKHCAINVW